MVFMNDYSNGQAYWMATVMVRRPEVSMRSVVLNVLHTDPAHLTASSSRSPQVLPRYYVLCNFFLDVLLIERNNFDVAYWYVTVPVSLACTDRYAFYLIGSLPKEGVAMG